MKLITTLLSLTPFVTLHSQTYEELATTSIEQTKSKNAKLEREYKIGQWERWDLDQVKGTLIFSNSGDPKLVIKAAIAGSISTKTNTWLWSWSNHSIQEIMSSPILTVKDIGIKNKYERLSNPKWDADEIDGWEVAAIANSVINGIGVYRGPTGNGFVYLVMTEVISYNP